MRSPGPPAPDPLGGLYFGLYEAVLNKTYANPKRWAPPLARCSDPGWCAYMDPWGLSDSMHGLFWVWLHRLLLDLALTLTPQHLNPPTPTHPLTLKPYTPTP